MKYLIFILILYLIIPSEQYILYNTKNYHREGYLAIDQNKLWLRLEGTWEGFNIYNKSMDINGYHYFIENSIARGTITITDNKVIILLIINKNTHFNKRYLHILPKR